MVKPAEKSEEKHQVCDDFNKARAVLESFALKVDAFPLIFIGRRSGYQILPIRSTVSFWIRSEPTWSG